MKIRKLGYSSQDAYNGCARGFGSLMILVLAFSVSCLVRYYYVFATVCVLFIVYAAYQNWQSDDYIE